MRIEIDDAHAYRHTIDSQNPELIGRWFVEKCLLLMSENVAIGECRLRIWPSTREESQSIGVHDKFLNKNALRTLAESILTVSGKLSDG